MVFSFVSFLFYAGRDRSSLADTLGVELVMAVLTEVIAVASVGFFVRNESSATLTLDESLIFAVLADIVVSIFVIESIAFRYLNTAIFTKDVFHI